MMRSILFILLSLFSFQSISKDKVVYKYKQYEKFDLGDLEIKGSIIAPGDLSVKERRRKIFKRKLFERKDFDSFIKKDIKFIR
jgi:hypothetical protein